MELATIAYRIATDAQFALDLKESFHETLTHFGISLTEEEEKAVRMLMPGFQLSLAGVGEVNVLNAEPWAL